MGSYQLIRGGGKMYSSFWPSRFVMYKKEKAKVIKGQILRRKENECLFYPFIEISRIGSQCVGHVA